MTWATSTRSSDAWKIDTGINTPHQAALEALILPEGIADAGALQTTAATAAGHRADWIAATQQLNSLIITPWQHGEPLRRRQVGRVLTAQAAQAILAEQAAGHAAMLAFLLPADNPAQLVKKLNQLATAIPHIKLTQAISTAQAFASHEGVKLFLRAESVNHATGDQHQATAADSIISLSEAVASDTDPVAVLNEFSSRRAARHADQIAALTAPSGLVEWALYLSEDIDSQLQSITTPDATAPYSAAFAFLGDVAALASLKGELGL